MTIQDAYNHWSSTYDSDRNLTRDLDERVVREILANRPCGATLEIGCGTGKNTRFLASISQQVLAVDFSPGMLRSAKEKVEAPNVMFCRTDLTRHWPLQGASVDRIVCNLVLEHIADLSLIFSEAFRCLRKGGEFFISELHPFRQYQGKKASFQSATEQIEIQAFVHHITDFLHAGESNDLVLADLQEWWDAEGQNKPPRLITFLFNKPNCA